MNNTDNTVFLKHILDCIAKVERYLQGYDFESFKTTSWLQMRLLEMLR